MRYDLYVWASPRDLDGDAAAERLAAWEEAEADPSAAPFDPSDDVGWFYVELLKDDVDVDAVSDGVPDPSSRPIWLTTTQAAPARIVAMRLRSTTTRDDLDTIHGLAAKYDLVLFEPRGGTLATPLADMAAYATATFWPRGALQAFVAGSVGAAIAVISWAWHPGRELDRGSSSVASCSWPRSSRSPSKAGGSGGDGTRRERTSDRRRLATGRAPRSRRISTGGVLRAAGGFRVTPMGRSSASPSVDAAFRPGPAIVVRA